MMAEQGQQGVGSFLPELLALSKSRSDLPCELMPLSGSEPATSLRQVPAKLDAEGE